MKRTPYWMHHDPELSDEDWEAAKRLARNALAISCVVQKYLTEFVQQIECKDKHADGCLDGCMVEWMEEFVDSAFGAIDLVARGCTPLKYIVQRSDIYAP